MTTRSRRSVLKLLAGSGFVLAGVSAAVRKASAGDPPAEIKAELLILHATNEGKGIDPGIGDLPELKKPPFSSYDTYKLLEKASQKLPKGKEQEKKLPNDDKLLLTYKDMVSKKDQPDKFVIPARIVKKDGDEIVSATYTAPKGQFFFVAGPKFTKGKAKGILVIGFKII